MAVYSAKAAATAVGDPTGWPYDWPFPPAGGNDGPWPPGFPEDIDDTILVRLSTTTGKYTQDSGATAWGDVTLPFASSSANRLWCGQGNLIYLFNPGTLAGGTQTISCYCSLDGGMTWNTRGTMTLTTAGSSTVWCAMLDDMVYVSSKPSSNATYGNGVSVWNSSDGGATWTEKEVVAPGSGVGNPKDIAVLADGTVAVLYDNLVDVIDCYTSGDEGATFAKAGTITPAAYSAGVTFLTTDGDGTNLIATGTDGMYLSSNSGATWSTISTTAHGCAVGYGDNMLSCIATKLRKSADNGATWSDSDTLAMDVTYAHRLAAWSNGFAAISGTSVYLSTTTSTFVATTEAPAAVTLRGIHVIEEV